MDRSELRLEALKLAQEAMGTGAATDPAAVVQMATVYANWLDDHRAGPVDFHGRPTTLELMDAAMGPRPSRIEGDEG